MEVDLNDVTLEEYRQSVLDAVERDAEMLSKESPRVVHDSLNNTWERAERGPKGPVHKWTLKHRFGNTHKLAAGMYDEMEAAPLLDLKDKPLYDILTDVPLVSTDVKADEELRALEEMLDNPDFLREVQSWEPAYLDPPYKGTHAPAYQQQHVCFNMRRISVVQRAHDHQVPAQYCTGPRAT